MMRLYKVGGVIRQYEEGKQPKGAEIVQKKPEPKPEVKELECKAVEPPKNKMKKGQNK